MTDLRQVFWLTLYLEEPSRSNYSNSDKISLLDFRILAGSSAYSGATVADFHRVPIFTIQNDLDLWSDFKFSKNYPFEHQMEDTECGVYSIYFIVSMIENPNFKRFMNKRITDKEMEKYRHVYFRI